MATLVTPLRGVVGDRTATALADGLEVATVGDLLQHYPRRYAERGELTDLGDLAVGEHVTVLAEVRKLTRRPIRHRPGGARRREGSLLEVVVGDGRRSLTLTFFNQAWRERELRVGRQALFAGKVSEFRGIRQLSHPDYQLLDAADGEEPEAALGAFAGALIAVYPGTAALPSWKVAQCVRLALDSLDPLEDPLPAVVRHRHRLLPLGDALGLIHQPHSRADVDRATERLKWDEALVLQLTLARRRAATRRTPTRPRPARADGLLAAFDARLPFTLTAGQREIGAVILDELAQPHPMHRLLQGEVGSGKTVVALRAMLAVVDSGGQAALLAPTEVLASQHARSLRQLLGPLAAAGELEAAGLDDGVPTTRVTLLTGSASAGSRRRALADIASGAAGIVVGTHALLEEDVVFADLGLVVVDEQHRFGVEQRDALRARGGEPAHLLVMTATPIPRTVAMTVYGDLEISTLRELPSGRSPIKTTVVPAAERPGWLAAAWERVHAAAGEGHQSFVVCPRIHADEAEDDASGHGPPDEYDLEPAGERGVHDTAGGARPARRPAAAVLAVAPMLTAGPLAGLRVEVLHGGLPGAVKDEVMTRFAAGRLDVVIATTVIEVGVDVPTATIMIVLDADRFGVSQLHQLRGRVGRGSAPGLCLLVTDAPVGSPARTRLDAVASTVDGFELSRFDLEQRREGNVLGAQQSGRRSGLRLLTLLRDEKLITAAREEAVALIEKDPDLSGFPGLAAAVAETLDEARAEYLEKA